MSESPRRRQNLLNFLQHVNDSPMKIGPLTISLDVDTEFLEYLTSVERRISNGSDQERYAVIRQELTVTYGNVMEEIR